MTAPLRQPAAFFGHGSPMWTLEDNRYTRGWQAFGSDLPERPRAILVISAHWYLHATAVTAMAEPSTIHDFFGFPDELFAVRYPAPGDPQLAAEIADLVRPTRVGLDRDSWGLDHGCWTVLRHIRPQADVPVVQLSVDATKSFDEHLALGARLAPLRDRGVLVVASGNVVHNLRAVRWNRPGSGDDWAVEFDRAASDLLTTDPGRAPALAEHPLLEQAAPTPDHLVPLLYLAGIAAAAGTTATPTLAGCELGSLSMTSYLVDDQSPHHPPASAGAPHRD